MTIETGVYDERLVECGELYPSLDFINQWDDELSQMNAGKRGRPFLYLERFVEWMVRIRAFLQMPYRQIEGFVRKLAEFISHLKAADYTIFFRRIKFMDLSLTVMSEILAENVIVAAGSAGIKVINWGEWMRERWSAHRGWIKVHAMIGIETNLVLDLEIADESVQDDQTFTPILDQTQLRCGEEHSVDRALGDGAYDHNSLFSVLEHRWIVSEIKTRVNAATYSTESPYRAECVKNRNRLGRYHMWSWAVMYGMRWKAEGCFSTFKWIFGEGVRATSRKGVFHEIQMKMNCYNMLIALAAGSGVNGGRQCCCVA